MSEGSRAFGLPWPALNDGIFYEDVVCSSLPACSVLDFYCAKYKESAPREGWVQRIENGQIKIDGKVVKAQDAVVRAGYHLTYHRLPWTEPPAPWKLEVLYEDDYLLAVNKPSGLQVLPGGLYQQRTVLTQLKWRCMEADVDAAEQDHSSKLCSAQPSPVHRLGRGTSGVLLCAKTKAAKSKLSSDLATGASSEYRSVAERRVVKIYRALAAGVIRTDEILITQPIGTVTYPGVSKGLYVAISTGKPSQSKVVVLSRNLKDNCTLVEVEIFSGRPHQIRIHLAYIGHPLVGDPLYIPGGMPEVSSLAISDVSEGCETNQDDGGYLKPANAVPGDCGYNLHAHKLSIIHPTMGKLLEIVAPCPPLLCMPAGEETTIN